MYSTQPLRDPLGNTIRFPLQLLKLLQLRYAELSKVITAPDYVINEKNSKLYFFRLINYEINMLVEAKYGEKEFVVNACIVNPTTEYVSGLLRKGALLSF
jgi:hypothetical protein